MLLPKLAMLLLCLLCLSSMIVECEAGWGKWIFSPFRTIGKLGKNIRLRLGGRRGPLRRTSSTHSLSSGRGQPPAFLNQRSLSLPNLGLVAKKPSFLARIFTKANLVKTAKGAVRQTASGVTWGMASAAVHEFITAVKPVEEYPDYAQAAEQEAAAAAGQTAGEEGKPLGDYRNIPLDKQKEIERDADALEAKIVRYAGLEDEKVKVTEEETFYVPQPLEPSVLEAQKKLSIIEHENQSYSLMKSELDRIDARRDNRKEALTQQQQHPKKEEEREKEKEFSRPNDLGNSFTPKKSRFVTPPDFLDSL